MNIVFHQCPLLGAYLSAQHAVVDVVSHICTSDFPLHNDRLLLGARRGFHITDVAAGGEAAGNHVAVEVLAGV